MNNLIQSSLISLLSVFIFTSCNAQQSENKSTGVENTEQTTVEFEQLIKRVSVAEFKKELSAQPDAIILDVRTPGEFAGGAIEGAINIDFYGDNFSQELDKLDKSKPIFVYCKSGGRSGQATAMLTEKNFQTVYDLKGGYTAWSK